MLKKSVLALGFASVLSACGGGSGGDESPKISVSVNAGSDITVNEKIEFTLKALGSPSGGVFSWQVISGPEIEGFPQEGEELTVTAPDVKGNSPVELEVSYTAPDGTSARDTLIVNVVSVNLFPQAKITQTAPESGTSKYADTITLSGVDSSDRDENGSIVAYQWKMLSGPSTITTERTDQATLSFVHPLLASASAVEWQLTVTDDEGGTGTTKKRLSLLANDQLVLANAGSDQQVQELDTVTLDASSSVTVDGQFSCMWEQVSNGSAVTLADERACKTTFMAPLKSGNQATSIDFKVTLTDSAQRTGTDTVNVEILPKPLGKLNDTGTTLCYNNTTQISCGSSDFPGQDAELGRDAVVQFIPKSGQGNQAFDFTKFSEEFEPLPSSDENFACVLDNVTGLIWEVKEATAGILPNTSVRNAQNHYTWFLAGKANVTPGAPNSTCPQDDYCGVQALIDAVNEASFCGGNNWRLPTYMELANLLDHNSSGDYLLDPTYFPHVPDQALLGHQYYWTTQTSVDGTDGKDANLVRALVIDMKTGNDVTRNKSQTAYVRLVRRYGEED
ncbi:DUF1566 domain-containing protein [Pseudoalteromonas sp. R3]|uniref:Lcl C-terminal domain-containing protein n=1 Tax=Pseudoalteromonas sp. R3 TaxID=1709477 RepID=UPI0006B667ED|nr:DUF1566 domain-containing protein [Pseudoalteromonas sp. R3]AZZ96983.1 DUF1566 domain-containing protein [Pseudoalteromonas sp. R3]